MILPAQLDGSDRPVTAKAIALTILFLFCACCSLFGLSYYAVAQPAFYPETKVEIEL